MAGDFSSFSSTPSSHRARSFTALPGAVVYDIPLPRLRRSGVKLVSCYDANETLKGTFADGLPIYSASELKRAAPEFMVVTARHAVAPVSAMLTDPGRNRFCGAVFEKDQYFCLPRFSGSEKEFYVDAGAYVGDSMERFIWSQNGVFSKIYAFEPGPRQFAALRGRTERLIDEWALDSTSIELINAGLNEIECSVSVGSYSDQITNLSIHSSSETTGMTADVVSLDNFLKGDRVTFLKADVEGMEIALLKGARSSIRQQKPKIAICVYHYPTDIPDIANYLAELVPEYQFALRHHSPQLMETVLYCWAD